MYLPQESTAKYYLAVVQDIINIKTDGIVLKLDAIRMRQRPLAMSCSMADKQGGVLYEDNRPAILKFASAAGERIENCSSRAVLAATGAEVLAFTNSFDKCSLYCGIVAAASICVAGLAKVYYIFGYISHPAEVRARQAEKLDTPDVLKFRSF